LSSQKLEIKGTNIPKKRPIWTLLQKYAFHFLKKLAIFELHFSRELRGKQQILG
jgi:hypothetical protein